MLMTACWALLPAPPARYVAPQRTAAPRLCVGEASADLIRLHDISRELQTTLNVQANEADSVICELLEQVVAPLARKIYTPSVPSDERKAAIEGLSRSLDELEEGPLAPLQPSATTLLG
jgi:hypothetical protein